MRMDILIVEDQRRIAEGLSVMLSIRCLHIP